MACRFAALGRLTMNPANFKHFVVTRLGIGIHHEDWYRSTLGLFEAVTFPSLCAQSSPDFASLLIVDRDMPAAARSRLAAIIEGRPNFHVVSIDLTAMNYVHQGCFDYVWDRCQDYLLGHRLITNPLDYVVTSVLDGDDAWHSETVARVNDRVRAELPAFLADELRHKTWSRHTGGMCLTFPVGLRWFTHTNVVEPMYKAFIGMSVFVAARFSSGISACSSRHSAWPWYCRVLEFRTVIVKTEEPMWVYVRHDRSEVPWDSEGRRSDPACVENLHRDFAIDFAKVEQWRGDRALRTASDDDSIPLQHSGMWAKEQLDCYFRITALNRQIAALEGQAERCGSDTAAAALIARQRALRDELCRVFREQARTMFR